VPRGCSTLWANVHHTLVSVCSGTRGGFGRNDGSFDDIPQLPDVARPFVLPKSIPVAVRRAVFVDKLLEELREGIRALSGH
jgi:hypothetical protein